ncbi:MAG TPA: c-type cytochrome [Bryobacteraceae bacterium]|nr:c-type cytochrome [Bryobacteraceae bacterium]
MVQPGLLRLLSIAICWVPVFAQAPQSGQQLFNSMCAACHGLDGRGGEHAQNIATNENIKAQTDRALLNVVRDGIPPAGMPAFGSSLGENQMHAIVTYLRLLQDQEKAGTMTGNPENGGVLFFGSGGCSACHMMNGKGGFLGADLSNYGSAHTPMEIREAILNPNKNRDPRRGTVVVTTRGGVEYKGVLRNEDNFSLQMQTADGSFHFLYKSEVARIKYDAPSIMPANYESQLGDKGVNDLVVYLVDAATSQPMPPPKDK